MDFDKRINDSDDDYFRFIHWLEEETAKELKLARGNEQATRLAILHYLETGYGAYLTSGELVDFFCVSSPSVLDKAEYSDEETEFAVKLYDDLNPKVFSHYYPNSR